MLMLCRVLPAFPHMVWFRVPAVADAVGGWIDGSLVQGGGVSDQVPTSVHEASSRLL